MILFGRGGGDYLQPAYIERNPHLLITEKCIFFLHKNPRMEKLVDFGGFSSFLIRKRM